MQTPWKFNFFAKGELFKPKKILIIRFSSLGDLVLTTPIFRELNRVFPDAKITMLTSHRDGAILKNNPNIDHFIFHKRRESYNELNNLIKILRNENFDLVYDAHRSLRSIWIVCNLKKFMFSKSPKTWFINKRSWQRSFLINFKINFLKHNPSQRQQLLLPLQNQTSLALNNHTELFPDQDDVMLIRNFLYKNNLFQKKYVAIGASASYPLKRWPYKYFHKLISRLVISYVAFIL